MAEEKNEWLLLLVDDFLENEWTGSATELSDALIRIDPGADISPLNIKKQLNSNMTLFKENGIIVSYPDRKGTKRLINLARQSA